VTPAAVYWHVRSKDELLDGVVNQVFMNLEPPPCDSGTWVDRARELYTWFRRELLARRKLVFTQAFSKMLPYAFVQVGVAGKNILQEAGFAGADLPRASRTLYWHTFAFVIQEVGMSYSPLPTTIPKLVLDRGISALNPDDFVSFVEALPRMIEFDVDDVYAYSLGCLLRGLERDLERCKAERKPPPGRTA